MRFFSKNLDKKFQTRKTTFLKKFSHNFQQQNSAPPQFNGHQALVPSPQSSSAFSRPPPTQLATQRRAPPLASTGLPATVRWEAIPPPKNPNVGHNEPPLNNGGSSCATKRAPLFHDEFLRWWFWCENWKTHFFKVWNLKIWEKFFKKSFMRDFLTIFYKRKITKTPKFVFFRKTNLKFEPKFWQFSGDFWLEIRFSSIFPPLIFGKTPVSNSRPCTATNR